MEFPNDSAENPPWWLRILIGRRPKRTLIRLVVLIVVSFVLFKFVLIPIRVVGNSMSPTYRNGGINFVNRCSYLWRKPKRGDVVGLAMVTAHDSQGPRILLLKRIIGLPGEQVSIHRGVIKINGRQLEEPYAKSPTPWKGDFGLGDNEYLLIGDNREISSMERVAEIKILGRVLF